MSIDTVNDLPPRVQYIASASQTVFPYPFPIFQDGDLVVDVDGLVKTLTTDYTVSGEGDDTGGNVTFGIGLAAGSVVTIYRETAIERDSDFQLNGPMFSTSVNDEFDKVIIIEQELRAAIKRCLRIPFNSEVADADIELTPISNWFNKYLTFDSTGKPTPALLSSTTMTQESISALLYPILPYEEGFGVVDRRYGYGNVKRFGAFGNGVNDDTDAIQNCINACIKSYDETATTHDGNNVTFRDQQVPVFFPKGNYNILDTIEVSFRNHFRIYGESEYNTIISYVGPTAGNNTILNLECSNYAEVSHLTLNGGFKASNGIYCAGNGTNAVGSKGNVTGNAFHHLFFWNQPGDLSPIVNDYPDQYAPRSAMLCLYTDKVGVDNSYNSCDDSYVSHCRFATNSVNNSYALAVSSSNIQINNCIMFAANGCLVGNGGSPWFHQCAFEIYGYQAIDSTHNHAGIKYALGNYGVGVVNITDCYGESGYNGSTPSTAILAYFGQYTGGGSLDFKPRVSLTVRGGLWSQAVDNAAFINIGGGNRGHVRLIDAQFQGDHKPLIYAPDCAVYIEDHSTVTSASTDNYHTYQALSTSSYLTWQRKFMTPDGVLTGEDSASMTLTVGNTDYPAQLKFTSMDEALTWVSATHADVVINLTKNDTIANAINLRGNLTINLGGFTLTFNAIVQNYGRLAIAGSGTAISTGRKLYNYGTLNLSSCTVNALVSSLDGSTYATSCTFAGTDDSIVVNGISKVVIDNATCTYSGSEYVVNIASGKGDAIIHAVNSTTPTTGKWARGTKFVNTLPAGGGVNIIYATANGVGAAATWLHQGVLA